MKMHPNDITYICISPEYKDFILRRHGSSSIFFDVANFPEEFSLNNSDIVFRRLFGHLLDFAEITSGMVEIEPDKTCEELGKAKPFSEEGIKKLKEFLGEDGITFFTDVYKKYGYYNVWVWEESGFPHIVHFQEGMQVRNFLRKLEECSTWNDLDFDNNWKAIVVRLIRGNKKDES